MKRIFKLSMWFGGLFHFIAALINYYQFADYHKALWQLASSILFMVLLINFKLSERNNEIEYLKNEIKYLRGRQ